MRSPGTKTGTSISHAAWADDQPPADAIGLLVVAGKATGPGVAGPCLTITHVRGRNSSGCGLLDLFEVEAARHELRCGAGARGGLIELPEWRVSARCRLGQLIPRRRGLG